MLDFASASEGYLFLPALPVVYECSRAARTEVQALPIYQAFIEYRSAKSR